MINPIMMDCLRPIRSAITPQTKPNKAMKIYRNIEPSDFADAYSSVRGIMFDARLEAITNITQGNM